MKRSRPCQRVSWNRCWLEVDKYRDMLMGGSTLVNLQFLMIYIYIYICNIHIYIYIYILWYHFVPRPHSTFYILYSRALHCTTIWRVALFQGKGCGEGGLFNNIKATGPGKGGHWSSATSLLDDIGGWYGNVLDTVSWIPLWHDSDLSVGNDAIPVKCIQLDIYIPMSMLGTNCPVFSLSSPTELLQEALPSMRAVNPYAGHHNEFEIKCLSKKWASHHNNTNRKVFKVEFLLLGGKIFVEWSSDHTYKRLFMWCPPKQQPAAKVK